MTQRRYSKEYIEEAVKLVTEQGLSHAAAAQELGISSSTMSGFIYRHQKRCKGMTGKSEDPEQTKIHQLEKEVRILKMERDILKKATAFFAKENQ